jgi:hypothetical protein
MRCELALAVAVALGLGAAGCTSGICSRSSDCSTGYICTSAGACEVPADASIDAADGGVTSDDAAETSIDAPDATTIGDASTADAFDDGEL